MQIDADLLHGHIAVRMWVSWLCRLPLPPIKSVVRWLLSEAASRFLPVWN